MNNKTLEERFVEQFNKQFIDGGIAVLLDYPPHDRVLDEGRTLKFIKKEIDLAVQQERDRCIGIIKNISEFADSASTLKERIIKAINQDYE